jgi:hypothetical protein
MALGDFLTRSEYEPKQSHKFIVLMGSPTRLMVEAKSANKPKISFSVVELNAVDGQSVYYPASPSWDPITITFMAGGQDAMFQTKDTDVSRGIVELLSNAGYNRYGERQYKSDASDAFNTITIRQINRDGLMVEEWQLINPFFERIDFGELDYSSESLSEVTITIRYDHALVNFANGVPNSRGPSTFLQTQ